MAAYAALVSLMNNIEQMMKHPRVSSYLDTKQIQPLLEKASFLLDIVETNNYSGGSKEAEDLERQITSAAHAAEDVIESHIVDQILAAKDVEVNRIQAPKSFESLGAIQTLRVQKIREMIMRKKRPVQNFNRRRMVGAAHAPDHELHTVDQSDAGTSFNHSIDLQQRIEDMDAVLEKAMHMELVKEKEGYKDEHIGHSLPLSESGETTAAVGLDDELTQLMDELTGHQSHDISSQSLGWAVWFNVKKILSQFLSSLGKSISRSAVGELGEQLHKTLIGRRYLVVLDDIWSVEAWDAVRRYLPDDGNSSRVVLTTRLSYVASVCGSSCFTMNFLDEDKSWKLFCEKALFPQKDDPLQLEDIGKKIVRLCKGLALSIVVIGGFLLKSPRTVGYWKGVAKGLKSDPDSKEKEESLDILYLSYNHLPPHLKPCFLYMGVLEEDFEIRVSTVTRLWVAEGFIRSKGTLDAEEIAEGYLNDLIDRNLISVSTRRRNGKIGSCGIHDLLRDLCVKVGEQQDFFYVRKHGEIRSSDRRFTCDPFEEIDIQSPVARSILAKTYNAESIKCKLLRVLVDAEHSAPPEEIFCFYENVNLRYLAYENPIDLGSTWKLPASAFLIWNLQALIITTYWPIPLLIATPEIWKMQQLRHIKYERIYLTPPPSDGQDNTLFILENLQTLTTAVNLRLSEAEILIPNIKKLRLLYRDDLEGYDDSLIECLCYLDRLHKLESLKIKIKLKNQVQASSYEVLHEKLAFPSSLKKLSLSHCRLHWNDLGVIGSLPRLQVLYLENLSVTEGEQWSPADGQFLHLKFLKIEECNLYVWDADNSHFPVLEKLVLHNLINLEEIPMDIGEIPTLALICVDCCSESVAISAMRIKEDQLESQDNDALQIQLRIFESDMETFKERVEEEQLTLSYIQLESVF